MLTPGKVQPFDGRFQGLYVIENRVDNLNYLVKTPDLRKRTQLCHINRLKSYIRQGTDKMIMVGAKIPKKGTDNYFAKENCAKAEPPVKLENSVILRDLKKKFSHLSNHENEEPSKLITKYKDLFSDIPRSTTLIKHNIELVDDKPIRQHPYRLNPRKLKVLRQEIKYMLDNRIIEPSQSEWASPCVLVDKLDGSTQFCTDYRRVNAVTKTNSYPIPRIEDCIDRIGKAQYITKCDLLKGYWAVLITDRVKEISSFVTPEGACQYKVMLFGMKNSPATFVRLMNH